MKRTKKPPKTLRKWAEGATLEKDVRAGILAAFHLHGWRAFRIEPIHGTVDYGDSKGFVSMNDKGDPDIIAVRSRLNMLSDIGQAYKGPYQHLPDDALLVECKRPKGGKLSPEQIAKHAVLLREGITVIVARSWDEVVSEARKVGLEVERCRP